jgi:hypothetical protein
VDDAEEIMQALIRIGTGLVLGVASTTGVWQTFDGTHSETAVRFDATTHGATVSSASTHDVSLNVSGVPAPSGGASSENTLRLSLPAATGGFQASSASGASAHGQDDTTPFHSAAAATAAAEPRGSASVRSLTQTDASTDQSAQLQGSADVLAGASGVGGASELALRSD